MIQLRVPITCHLKLILSKLYVVPSQNLYIGSSDGLAKA